MCATNPHKTASVAEPYLGRQGTRSFAALGGVARRGINDNMKTAVDKVKKGPARLVNARFAAMCSHYLFDADFCKLALGCWGR